MDKDITQRISRSSIEDQKILVIMNDDDAIKEFADIAFELNRLYCKEYGYDIERHHKVYNPNIHMSWQKVQLLADTIKINLENSKYTHIVWIDSDAFLNPSSSFSLTDFLPNGDRWASFSEDKARMNIGSYSISINNGFMIFRVCIEAFQCLQYVMTNYSEKDFPFWEQCAFIFMIQRGEISMQNIMFFPYNVMQTFPLSHVNIPWFFNPLALVYHYPGASKEVRVEKLTEQLNKNKMIWYVNHNHK